MPAREVNFDCLVGPTHNYAGLSYGNVASTQNKDVTSNPREAALQGLAKMKFVRDLGLVQGVIPPQERPDIATLRKLGFSGSDAQVLEDGDAVVAAILAELQQPFDRRKAVAANAAGRAHAESEEAVFDTDNDESAE